MLRRFLFLIVAVSWLPLIAADLEHVSFSAPSKVGAASLPPGLYKIRVQGNLVFLTDESSKKAYTAIVRLEKLPKPSSYTAAQGRAVEGINRVESIVVAGEDFRLVF